MRRGCWDIDARIADMDINGVWASLNFPSQITGFSGRVFSDGQGPRTGPGGDPGLERLAVRGVVAAVSRPDHPLRDHLPGRPRAGGGGDPAERRARVPVGHPPRAAPPDRPAQPVLGLLGPDHRRLRGDRTRSSPSTSGSSGMPDMPEDSPLVALGATLFGQMSLSACAEWLWSGLPVRFPTVKIAMSEGGIGWVAMLLDRLDNIVDRSGYGRGYDPSGLLPAEVLARNFWFCTIDDPSTIDTRHRIGIDHIMVEVDYPHGDSTWPDTQVVIERCWGHLPGRGPAQADPPERRPAVPLAAARPPGAVTAAPFAAGPERTPARRCRPARSWSSWPGPCGARGTTTTWPATSPTGSPTAPCCATRGCCCGRSSGPTTCWSSISTATAGGSLAGPPRDPAPPRAPPSAPGRRGGGAQPSPVRHGLGRPGSGARPATTRARPSGGGEMVVVDEYDGPVNSRDSAARAVTAMGDGRHGAAGQPRRLRHRREHPGRPPAGRGPRVPEPPGLAGRGPGGRARAARAGPGFFRASDGEGFAGFFEAMARQELRLDPHCLEPREPAGRHG